MKLTIRNLFIIILFGGIFYFTLRPVVDPDFWWHLQTGKLIVQTRTIPKVDLFSFTAGGNQWLTHEWLSELLIFKSFRIGGYGLLILIFSAIETVTFIFVYLRCPTKSKPYIAGFSVLLGALTSMPIWGVRPQMLTLLFTSFFLFLLDRFLKNEDFKTLIPLPLVTILWANLHAGFILGIVLEIIFLAGYLFNIIIRRYHKKEEINIKPFWILFAIILISIFSAAINPAGFRILSYPFLTLTDSAMQAFIREWFSPDFHQTYWQPFAMMLLALIGIGMTGKHPISITKIMLSLIFGYGALRSLRNIPLFAVVVSPILAEQLTGLIQLKLKPQKQSNPIHLISIAAIILISVIIGQRFIQTNANQQKAEESAFPKAAADWIIENKPEGKMFNAYNFGGYLIWRLYPKYQVYIDGRADLYGKDFVTNYMDIYTSKPGWENKLADDEIHFVFIESDSILAKVLRQSPAWEILYEDKLGVIFLRKST